MLRSIVLASLLAAVAVNLSADDSPRLQRLRSEAASTAGAVAEFWNERRAAGAPMVEPIANDATRVLVTFVWQGDAATKNAYVITFDQGQFDSQAYFARGRMAQISGTDVWYRTYRMPCDLVFSYRFSVNDPGTITRETPPEELKRRVSQLKADPLNPTHYAARSGDSSVAQLPCATPQPDMQQHDGVPHGKVTDETYVGPSGESHALQIYVPAQTARGAGWLPLVLTIGGQFAENYPIPAIMDNLIAAKQIPPVMVVTIGFSGMSEYVAASRSNERFARYVAKELLPWLRTKFPIARDPRSIAISGASAPGAGSMFVAMRYPEDFGNVITQSGGYVYPMLPAADELIPGDHPIAEPIARELASRTTLPFRVFLAVGTLDDMAYDGVDPRYGMTTVLVAARHLRDVLEARGYCLTYREFGGGHEALVWRRTFAEGVITLLGPTPPCAQPVKVK